MEKSREIARDSIEECFDDGITDWMQIKNRVKDNLTKYLYGKTHRKPTVLPIIMDI